MGRLLLWLYDFFGCIAADSASFSTEHLVFGAGVCPCVVKCHFHKSIKVLILEICKVINQLVKQLLVVHFFLCNVFMFIRKWDGRENISRTPFISH